MATQKDGKQKETKKEKRIEKTGELTKRGLQKRGVPSESSKNDSGTKDVSFTPDF